ncbi:bifunctional DNA primase/polymerase [Sphingomicrobium nitratireducens]|uniref:bifunctional DNA primase/polymerase n=1 Tax=Sphingomicrobium nitratireducens TaxID=2964666 RepID=UPI002240BCE1|nr:bifunctional DNA primase/polymerase [Sphingomicrobium nitratireducens]
MSGLFSEWQPRYAERGIATFPVRDKRPAVKGYLKVGANASRDFAAKFSNEDAFGFACERNGIAVLDVDTPDERILADALSEYGPTPIIVRSGSGNWQAWYRRTNEGRSIRPSPDKPIDILGGGFVVAPPSRSAKGAYRFEQGSLDDLADLPPMQAVSALPVATPFSGERIRTGQRNQELWRRCMTLAAGCSDFDELMKEAHTMNAALCYERLPDLEVMRVAASAWSLETTGQNWFGRGRRVVIDHTEVDNLMANFPDAFMLLTILRRRHYAHPTFMAPNGMASEMPGGGWTRKRLAAARNQLVDIGELIEERPACSHHGAAIYSFKGGKK